MINLRTVACVAALTVLAGCIGGGRGGPVATVPTGVEGKWVGADGVAVSSLQGGRFTSVSLTTGENLTKGTYTHRDQRTIDLSFYSVKSNRNTAATCLLVKDDQMNCTLSSGVTFVLARQPAVS